jgi:hypothetical protein
MRSATTVYRADGTPIEVVTVEAEKGAALPIVIAGDNSYEKPKLVESKAAVFAPAVAQSEPDR